MPALPLVTEFSFEDLVLQNLRPVLLSFPALHGAHSAAAERTLEELSDEMAPRVFFAQVDVQENPLIAATLGVRALPTLLLIFGGRLYRRFVGPVEKSTILRALSDLEMPAAA